MSNYIKKRFVYQGRELTEGPFWCITDMTAGSMRFRWNERNPVRMEFLRQLSGDKYKVAQIELIHSKIIYDISNADDAEFMQGDGIITSNKNIIPVVTVADCVPLYLYDVKSGTVGIFHSGWKGTGIIEDGIKKVCDTYGSSSENICIAIGPHIGSCCYNVKKDRAEFFAETFTPDCITKISEDEYSLSLTKANLASIKNAGVPQENITLMDECTCCYKVNGEYKYGSFRRQASVLPPDIELEERLKKFTVQAAFIIS